MDRAEPMGKYQVEVVELFLHAMNKSLKLQQRATNQLCL